MQLARQFVDKGEEPQSIENNGLAIIFNNRF